MPGVRGVVVGMGGRGLVHVGWKHGGMVSVEVVCMGGWCAWKVDGVAYGTCSCTVTTKISISIGKYSIPPSGH